MKYLIPFAALLLPVSAMAAQEDMQLESKILVENVTKDATGKDVVKREAATNVKPGGSLIIEISYRNAGAAAATQFVVTNPMPSAIAFEGGETPGAELSVDGGKNWGALAALAVTQADGTRRPAAPADVTHIRWAFKDPVPAGQSGQLSFRGKVK